MRGTLIQNDMESVVRRLPSPVAQLLQAFAAHLFVAGGFIRSCIANEAISDIDLFSSDAATAKRAMLELIGVYGRNSATIVETANAFTLVGPKPTVQIIHRWTFAEPESCIDSFDFTIAKAAIWWDGQWHSCCHQDYYADLAARTLIYAAPIRETAAGASLLRVIKFAKRGYHTPLESLASMLTAMISECVPVQISQHKLGTAILEQLREVDPKVGNDSPPTGAAGTENAGQYVDDVERSGVLV